jgi:hypothetical protein
MSKRTARVSVSRCLLVAALPGLALVASASADIGTLEGTGEWVAVWQSPFLAKEGQDLVNAGQYDLAAQRMACVVDSGTRVTATFTGGVPTLVNSGYIGGFARVVVIEGTAKGCTGYLESTYVRGVREPARARTAPSPCWRTKDEIAPIKAAADGGNLTAAGELNRKAAARTNECWASPCTMTKDEGDSIKAAYAAGNYKLGRELYARTTDRSNKCWGR